MPSTHNTVETDHAIEIPVEMALAQSPLTFDEIYDIYRQEIKIYKTTEPYKNPKTNNDKALREFVDASSQMTKEKCKELIKEKRFTRIIDRINHADPKVLAKTVKDGIALAQKKQGIQSKAESSLNLDEDDKALSSDEKSLNKDIGIYTAVVGGLSVLNPRSFVFGALMLGFGIALALDPEKKVHRDGVKGMLITSSVFGSIGVVAGLGAAAVGVADRNTKVLAAGLTIAAISLTFAIVDGILASKLKLAETSDGSEITPQQRVMLAPAILMYAAKREESKS
jgi:hypothetical protein